MMLSMGLYLVFASAAQRDVVVSHTGLDSNPGPESQPVATLAAARDRARATKSHSIVVKSGRYRLEKSIELDARDSGLTIRSSPGTHPLVMGGIELPIQAVHPCVDHAILDRIIESDTKKLVLEVDLGQLGLTQLAPIQARGFPHSGINAPNELFQGDEALTVARWPNVGFAKVGKVSESGNGEHDQDKPKRRPVFSIGERAKLWTHAEDPWLYGYWKFDWADESIGVHEINPTTGEVTLEGPAVYGVDAGTPFFAENLLEELDSPGEYFIDRKTARLYFIPAHKLDPHEPLIVSVLDGPLISVTGGANITVRGLDFGFSRGVGAKVFNGDHVRFEGCRFKDLGARAAMFDGGNDSGLQSCDVKATGEGGVWLAGGDRITLTPARNFVSNCEFQDFERRSQTYRPAVWLEGVGNRVSHCFMHDAPHSAIIYGGIDHVIEFNRFSKTISLTGDGGVVYTGRNWTARGTTIRNNWFEDNVGQRKWEPAIYVDDLGSGIKMTGNLIERCHWGFLIGGGRDNILQDNVLIDCDLAFDCDARGLGWAAGSRPTMMAGLLAVPYQAAIWRTEYPNLPDMLSKDPMAPANNLLRNNVLIRAGKVEDRMEGPFQKTAVIEGNVVEAQASKEELRRIEDIRKRAGLVDDALRRLLK